MNINTRTGVIDIRQSNPCQECGHVSETVPFEGRELCDSCLRPMTLERVKTSLAWEEATAVCVNGQYEFKGWYGDGLRAVEFLTMLVNAPLPDPFIRIAMRLYFKR